MRYQNEWLLLEADDMVDEMEHRQPTEEFLFYEAVMNGDVEAVRKNCEQERFMDNEGVGMLSQDPITNLKYHFVITTAMITRLCRQRGMELEQAFRMSDFYIRSLDHIHTLQEIRHLHDEMVLDYTEKMRRICRSDTGSRHSISKRESPLKKLRSSLACPPAISPDCLKRRREIRSVLTFARRRSRWLKICSATAIMR